MCQERSELHTFTLDQDFLPKALGFCFPSSVPVLMKDVPHFELALMDQDKLVNIICPLHHW
jgi:hypothetical protein